MGIDFAEFISKEELRLLFDFRKKIPRKLFFLGWFSCFIVCMLIFSFFVGFAGNKLLLYALFAVQIVSALFIARRCEDAGFPKHFSAAIAIATMNAGIFAMSIPAPFRYLCLVVYLVMIVFCLFCKKVDNNLFKP